MGEAAIAEICTAIVSLRRHVPEVGVIAWPVGCFGGMSIAAGLCSYLIATREARLGLNGPQVVEQRSGIGEFDSSDRRLVWSVYGGEQRYKTGLVDFLVEDDVEAIVDNVWEAFRGGLPPQQRSTQVDRYLERLAAIDPSEPPDPLALRQMWANGDDT